MVSAWRQLTLAEAARHCAELARFPRGSRWVVCSPYDGRHSGLVGRVVGYARDRYGGPLVELELGSEVRAYHAWVLFSPRSRPGREHRAERTKWERSHGRR